MPKVFRTILLCFLLSGLAMGQTAQKFESELELKAVFIANFVKLTVFPNDPRNGERSLCGDQSPMYKYLKSMNGRSIDLDVSLRVLPLSKEVVEECDVIYVDSLKGFKEVESYIAEKRPEALTVVGERGKGLIEMYAEQDRVKFDINARAAEKLGLGFRSQLLEVAQEVR